MIIKLTAIQFNHIAGFLERHGYGRLIGNFMIDSISLHQEPELFWFGNEQQGVGVTNNFLEVKGKLTIDDWSEFLQRIKNI